MDKTKLSETDICDKFIIPALTQSGWGTVEQIFREYTLRVGRVVVRDALREEASGGAQPNLNVGKIKSTLIPLPPLAEQYRIVARVQELRHLCGQLRERLIESRRAQSQLADALVAEIG